MDTDEIRNSLNRVVESLDIYNLPVDNALIYLLRIQDDRGRLPQLATGDVELAHHLARESMDALTVLLPMLYSRARKSKAFDLRDYRENNYHHAGRAIEIASAYSHVSSALTISDAGVYKIVRGKNKIYFVPSASAMRRDASSQVLNVRDARSFNVDKIYRPSASLLTMLSKHIEPGKSALVSYKPSGALNIKIPEDLGEELSKIFSAALMTRWTLNDEIQIADYTVGEAKRLWTSLVKLCGFQQVFSLASGKSGLGMQYLPMVLEQRDLCAFLATDTGVSTHKSMEFIEDLIFNNRITTNEVMFQPILRADKRHILMFSPTLVLFSNPERNLMKLWSKRYQGAYGKKIAQRGVEEERKLSEKIRRRFSQWNVVCSKKIEVNGQVLTDVDLGIYDRSNGEVFFGQVKWNIQPDSFVEVSALDTKLNDGMDQLDVLTEYIRTHPNAYTTIFGEPINNIRSTSAAVISTSSIGSFWAHKKYPVYSARIFTDTLAENVASLNQLLEKVKKKHSFKSYIDYRNVFEVISLDSVDYYIPGTHVCDKPRPWQRILRAVQYFFFSFLLRDHYLTWDKQHVMRIFG